MSYYGNGGVRTRIPEGIKKGDDRTIPKSYYLIPVAIGAAGLGTAFLLRGLVRMTRSGSSSTGRNSSKLKDTVGSGFFAKRYADGGFEPEMTKREAARILGCRESAKKDVITKRYRALMKANHPGTNNENPTTRY
ncbi:hypothetical protein AAMO2058_001274400 [Amorphochlora amoebiformis]